jgi:hypothetical protein
MADRRRGGRRRCRIANSECDRPGNVRFAATVGETWRKERIREARIFTGGVAPAGYNVKVLWVFLGASARGQGGSQLVVEGRRLDGAGRFREAFAAIGYAGQRGAPSYASTIDVRKPGCWRLKLSTGSLRAYADFLAVRS